MNHPRQRILKEKPKLPVRCISALEMKMKIEWKKILEECAEEVQAKVMPLFRKREGESLGIGAGGDEIKRIDMAAEKAITEVLNKHGISYILISEESGIKKFGNNSEQFYITVDPLDGSTNANRGIPFMATSIAVSRKPELTSIQLGMVNDLYHKTIYFAEKGKGAFRNNTAIVPSSLTVLRDTVIGVDLHTYQAAETALKLTSLAKEVKHLRHLGANALELCYVADGTADAFVDIRGKLRVTDMAAAYLVLKEAGAIITTLEGKTLNSRLSPQQRVSFVASGNLMLHKKILNLLK
jgi:myo-inositol-1(or 4)-monophosphatase